jgi:hypothetical protein
MDKPRGHNPSKLNEEQRKQIAIWLDTGNNFQGEQTHWTLKKNMRLRSPRHLFGLSYSQWVFVTRCPDKPMPVRIKKNRMPLKKIVKQAVDYLKYPVGNPRLNSKSKTLA